MCRCSALPRQLALGSEKHRYLAFDYLACVLAATPAERYLDSDNLVARLNHLDFVDIYTGLSATERQLYETRYPQESTAMTGLAERLRSEGMEQGMQQGMQQGEQTLLSKLLVRRFGPLDAETDQRLQQATTDELERWAENLLDAESLAEVFSDG
jgi:hypothetical protein